MAGNNEEISEHEEMLSEHEDLDPPPEGIDEFDAMEAERQSSRTGSKSSPSKRRMMRFMSSATDVTRQKMIDYLSVQRWSFSTLLETPPVIFLWGVIVLALSVQAHTQASSAVRTTLVSHFMNVTADPRLGVAPVQVVQGKLGLTTSCVCACAYKSSQLCAPPTANVSYGWRGNASLTTLQIMRDKAAYAAAVPTQSALGWNDLRNTDDVMFWVQHGFIPDVWHEESGLTPLHIDSLFPGRAGNGTTPADDSAQPGRIREWTKVIGGIRMRQMRLKSTTCSAEPAIVSRYKADCYKSAYETDSYGPAVGTYAQGFVATAGVPGAYDFLLPVGSTASTVISNVFYMLMGHGWLGPASESLSLQFAFLNAEVVPPLMGYAELNFRFHRSGAVRTIAKVFTVAAEPYPSPIYLFLDMIWVLMVLFLLCQQCFKMWRHRKNKQSYLSKYQDVHYWTVWNIIDWIVLMASFGLVIFFLVMTKAIANVAQLTANLPQMPAASLGQTALDSYNQQWSTIIDQMYTATNWWSYFRICMFWYMMMLTALHFKIFRGQPKLAQLARTLANAALDLIHFLAFFVVVLLNFAYCGYMIFGLQLNDWSTADKAINSSARAMMGDLNMEAMYAFAPVSTMVWYAVLIITMTFLMFNLVLATTLDHYQSVKARCGANTGIVLQTRLMIKDQLDRLANKTWGYRLTCCCRRDRSLPSQDFLLEEFMAKARLPDREKAGIRSGVLGAKAMRKEREKDVFSGQGADSASLNIAEPGESVDVDMLAMKLDLEYGGSLSEGCLAHANREYDPEDAKLGQLRTLVNIAEESILNMNARLEKCDIYARGNVAALSTRLMSLETLTHSCLQELVVIAAAAGVPTNHDKTAKNAPEKLPRTVGGLRAASKVDKQNSMLQGSMKGIFQKLGTAPAGPTISKSFQVETWHKTNKVLDRRGQKLTLKK